MTITLDPHTNDVRKRYARIHGRSPECADVEACPGTHGSGALPCWPCYRDESHALDTQ